jgi:hypothetical protein
LKKIPDIQTSKFLKTDAKNINFIQWESYKIYNQTSLFLIIGELIKIRKENPDLIDNELFNAYIEAIIDDHLGIYDDRIIIVQTIGNIKYYR